ncbi:MAG TPA: tRNA (adenosine(37)-N6)-threonylcarbamoyltransferase complex dimerization subunit type 1 TsaB [Longimicrobiales bacterium]|nr:tRNA (adenosine(37)-N6)-threonylcarbamoyltransferase complex dimerization subunit type 1 TsaB [Longimicrobiales bacterium]
MLLGIETSTATGSVAVGDEASVLAEVVLGVQSRHAESVLPAVEFALATAGLTLDGLDGVVVGAGPGSFTGVRVGAATAKGLVRARGLPLFAYSGLLALASGAGVDRPVCALFDARRGEVYAACYRVGDAVDEVLAPGARVLEDVLDAVGGLDPLYAGDGALAYRDAIAGRGGRVAPAHMAVPRASALIWLATTFPARGRVPEPVSWEPSYLRDPGAVRGVGRGAMG